MLAPPAGTVQTRPVPPPRPLKPFVTEAHFAAAANTTTQFPPPVKVEIAFAGRSNVGKSSLLNGLMGRRNLARTSGTPGCTRQVAFFEVCTRPGTELMLVDLPGYGYAKRSKTERFSWGPLIEGYLLGRATLAAVVLLVDVRRGLESEERTLLELLCGPAEVSRRPITTVLVATKLDKLPRSQRKTALQAIERDAALPVFGFSSREDEYSPKIWKQLMSIVGPEEATPKQDLAVTVGDSVK